MDIFVRIEGFFMRLESYTEVPPTAAMTDEISKDDRKLLGGNDIEETRMVVTETRVDVAETRMVTAETLNVTHKIDDKVAVLVDDVKEANAGIQRSANIADEEKLTRETAKLALSSGPLDQPQYSTQGSPQGNNILVLPGGIFEEWKRSSSLLWVHGNRDLAKASCGFSGIIEDIISEQKRIGDHYIFYCDFRDEDKQNSQPRPFVISQLCAQSKICCDTLSAFIWHMARGTKTGDETLTRCLRDCLTSASIPIYIIVDALDECPNNSGLPTPREEVLDLVKNLVSLRIPNLHICVTSRPEIDIQSALEL
ncbi:hypothetical protein BGY98DRAFT_1192632 [Russula aff. rugulosa BPL654]|nr:hypothetical protein BGY98DRAFT_1192632 [Russula aff. rugulosa BPL654]